MELIANLLLTAGACAAGLYCHILSRRLKKFTDLETGVGGAVARLSKQVDELTKTLRGARETASKANTSVAAQTERAEEVARKLELMIASMHDLDIASNHTSERSGKGLY